VWSHAKWLAEKEEEEPAVKHISSGKVLTVAKLALGLFINVQCLVTVLLGV